MCAAVYRAPKYMLYKSPSTLMTRVRAAGRCSPYMGRSSRFAQHNVLSPRNNQQAAIARPINAERRNKRNAAHTPRCFRRCPPPASPSRPNPKTSGGLHASAAIHPEPHPVAGFAFQRSTMELAHLFSPPKPNRSSPLYPCSPSVGMQRLRIVETQSLCYIRDR